MSYFEALFLKTYLSSKLNEVSNRKNSSKQKGVPVSENELRGAVTFPQFSSTVMNLACIQKIL